MESNRIISPAENTPTGTPAAAQAAPQTAAPGKKRRAGLVVTLSILGVIALTAGTAALLLFGTLGKARSLLDAGQYEEAKAIYTMTDFMPDTEEKLLECDYARACGLFDAGHYGDASILFQNLGSYRDSEERGFACAYAIAEQNIADGHYDAAISIFTALGEYSDCARRVIDCKVAKGIEMYHDGLYDEVIELVAEYSLDSDEANVYTLLSMFRTNQQSGLVDQVTLEYMLDALVPFSDNEDVMEVISDPCFNLARFRGARWENSETTLDFTDNGSRASSITPWPAPDGSSISYYIVGNLAVWVMIDGEFWFSIDGYSNYDAYHPSAVYITGSDGSSHTLFCASE